MGGECEARRRRLLREVWARLGVADIRAFGLNWEDCKERLRKLGFAVEVMVRAL